MAKTTAKKNAENIKNGRTLAGVVTSTKMKDTIVVNVSRFVKHPKYGKYIKADKKFKAHDMGNTREVGDKVTIEECAPISKDKHFRLVIGN
jgi:small subunit ribosomal protein S17